MNTDPTTSPPVETVTDRIRRRAHRIFEARNGAPGSPTLDWLQAEQELRDADADRDADRTPPSRGSRDAARNPKS